MQPDGEADHAVVTSQPASGEQQVPPPTTHAPEPTEEGNAMDQLTVISDSMETSNDSPIKHPTLVTQFILLSDFSYFRDDGLKSHFLSIISHPVPFSVFDPRHFISLQINLHLLLLISFFLL